MRRVALMTIAAGLWSAGAAPMVPAQDAKAERGKYLVEEVARCQECHTPKTETGEFDRTKWMKGATLGATPSAPIPTGISDRPTSPPRARYGRGGGRTVS